MDQKHWIYDWNAVSSGPRVEVFDETLRDGLQSPSVADPPIDTKLDLLHYMADLGIGSADIGLPAAGQRAEEHVLRMVQEINQSRLPIAPACAARTTVADIRPIADVSQRTGIPIEVYAFIGSSPIRQYAEGWDLRFLVQRVEEAARFCADAELPLCLVTEDTTRSSPGDLRVIFERALSLGTGRLCLCDTVGYATPDGARRLVHWTRGMLSELGHEDVAVDWHGHDDRGLALANALAAAAAGANRIHGTALGVGERAGNTATDQLLVNLAVEGQWDRGLQTLPAYCSLAARALGVEIPNSYPAVGRDAFRTATGVHASAIAKAQARGDDELADVVYSGVPASLVGRTQQIEVGHQSGASNVVHWLRRRGLEPEPALVSRILWVAKRTHRVLRESEVEDVVLEAKMREVMEMRAH